MHWDSAPVRGDSASDLASTTHGIHLAMGRVQVSRERKENVMSTRLIFVSRMLLLGVALAGMAAPVCAQGYLGVAAGVYEPEDEEQDRTEVYGLRGGYRFRPDFGLEASLSRIDLADTLPLDDGPSIPELDVDLQADLTNLDLSLQWFPRGGEFVVFAGPGVARIDVDSVVTLFGERFTDSTSEEIFTAHVGVAYSWRIGERFFVRPEARVRRYFDDEIDDSSFQEDIQVSYKSTDYEAGVMFGWRLGS
jgi:hypothetical protein